MSLEIDTDLGSSGVTTRMPTVEIYSAKISVLQGLGGVKAQQENDLVNWA